MIRPQYKATPDTLADGQFSGLRVDSTGALVVADGVIASSAIGNTDDAAWDGVAADATVISLLKAIAINTATP